jgi:hypothetical protein
MDNTKALKKRLNKLEKELKINERVDLLIEELPSGQVKCLFGDNPIVEDDPTVISKAAESYLKPLGKELGDTVRILFFWDEQGNPKQWLREYWAREGMERMQAKREVGSVMANIFANAVWAFKYKDYLFRLILLTVVISLRSKITDCKLLSCS